MSTASLSIYGQFFEQTKRLNNIYSKTQAYRDLIIKETQGSTSDSVLLFPVLKLKHTETPKKCTFSLVDSLYDIVAVYPNRNQIYVLDIKDLKISSKGSPTNQILSLLKKNNITNLFFTFFFDVDRHQLDILGSVKNDKLSLINKNIYTDDNIDSLLIEKFGSLENYYLYAANENIRNNALTQAYALFSDFALTDNWQFYVKYNKTDTLRNLSLLLKEIKLSTAVSQQSLRNIETNIMLLLRDTSSFKINFNKELYRDIRYHSVRFVLFMNKDISGLLQKHLGKDLYQQYTMQLKIGEGLSSLMEGSLSTRFKGNWNDIRNFIKTKTEIISREPFSYTIKNELRNPNIRTFLN